MDSLYVAWKYVTYNKAKTATLVGCITLIAFLPLALELLLNESERQLMARAQTTPLVVGAKGSALDLVMNTLYFDDEVPELISLRSSNRVADTGLAEPVPLYARFKARGAPIIGTTLDYFDLRGLKIADGRMLALLGECVLGAGVAERLGLKPGDSLVSSPETVFDLAGIYPLKMKVVGVLQRAHTADDLAVFVDLKTTWVIQGLGHGHEDVAKTKDTTVIMSRTRDKVVASPKLLQYMEITGKNIDSFHFHGDTAIYPLTAVIAVPNDAKSSAILRGRYLKKETTEQIVRPTEVIDGLLQSIFRIKNMIDAVILVVGLATIGAIVLVFALSLRLRQKEINTIFKIGCSRLTIARLVGAEIMIILVLSGALCAGLIWLVDLYSLDLVRSVFMS